MYDQIKLQVILKGKKKGYKTFFFFLKNKLLDLE